MNPPKSNVYSMSRTHCAGRGYSVKYLVGLFVGTGGANWDWVGSWGELQLGGGGGNQVDNAS